MAVFHREGNVGYFLCVENDVAEVFFKLQAWIV